MMVETTVSAILTYSQMVPMLQFVDEERQLIITTSMYLATGTTINVTVLLYQNGAVKKLNVVDVSLVSFHYTPMPTVTPKYVFVCIYNLQ